MVSKAKNIIVALDRFQGADRSMEDFRSPVDRDLKVNLEPNCKGACQGGCNDELVIRLVLIMERKDDWCRYELWTGNLLKQNNKPNPLQS